jgi:competence protein ComEC
MTMLVAIVSGFAGGVFLRSLFNFSWEPVVFALLLATLFAAAAFLKPRLAYTTGAVFCLFIALGMMRTALADTPLPDAFARDVRHRVSYEGIVVADPDVRDANQRVAILVSKDTESVEMLAVAPRHPSVAVGDRVWVSGTLQIPEAFSDDGGRIFRYDKYLQRSGVRFLLNYAYLRVIEEAPWHSLPALLARIKHSFLNGLAATLPEPHASLAGGVVIGGKSGLGNELKDAFVRSGLIQIIVLSGYNVMVVAEWVMAGLARTKLPRRWGAIAGALAILIFVGIAGASATALRAMVMALIALYARATARTYIAGRALLFVILLMLIWNPLYLVFDPGFGLSVAATAGLIWLAPIVERGLQHFRRVRQVHHKSTSENVVVMHSLFSWSQRHPGAPSGAPGLSETLSENVAGRANFWTNAVATTLAAQVAVLPLLLYDTGNLSLVAIPANLLTMPLVPLAMGLSTFAGFAGMLFGAFAPFFSIVLAYPAYLATAYLIFIAQKSAELPFAATTLPPFPFWFVIVSYAILIYIASSKRFSTTLQLRFAKKAQI